MALQVVAAVLPQLTRTRLQETPDVRALRLVVVVEEAQAVPDNHPLSSDKVSSDLVRLVKLRKDVQSNAVPLRNLPFPLTHLIKNLRHQ